MILNAIFAALALLSLALLLWQWVAARRFPLHQRSADLRIRATEKVPNAPNRSSAFQPAVTLLKSLKGADASTEDCLRSWFTQDYAGEVQILFGVAAADDPVCAIVRKLIQEFPKRDAQLVVCPQLIGVNAKVSKLAELEKLAKYEILAVSDADVRVPADFLVNAVAPFWEEDDGDKHDSQSKTSALPPHPVPLPQGEGATLSRSSDGEQAMAQSSGGAVTTESGAHGVMRPTVGVVNCFYRLANPSTLAMRWEAIAINADFWSQVLQSQMLKPLDFALGAVMLTRRKFLDEIGGFRSLADCLADDYQLGNRLARKGHRIVLCPVVVECWDPPMSWRAVWKHQLRWARTIRVCQPAPYFFSILSNAGFWAMLWFAWGVYRTIQNSHVHAFNGGVATGLAVETGLIGGAICLVFRIMIACDLQRGLTRSRLDAIYFWLVPIKDLLQAAIWVCAFAGNRIEWRGQVFKLRRDGTLVKTPTENQKTRG